MIDRTRNLDDNVVKAMTGLWPEDFEHHDDRDAWVKNARDAIAAVENWMKSD